LNRDLEELFKTIKHAFGLPEEMRLVLSGENPVYLGLVEGDTIHIYSNNIEEARKILVHEAIDTLISALISYALKSRDPEDIYRVKEAVVGVLERVVDEDKLILAGSTNLVSSILKRLGRSDLVEE